MACLGAFIRPPAAMTSGRHHLIPSRGLPISLAWGNPPLISCLDAAGAFPAASNRLDSRNQHFWRSRPLELVPITSCQSQHVEPWITNIDTTLWPTLGMQSVADLVEQYTFHAVKYLSYTYEILYKLFFKYLQLHNLFGANFSIKWNFVLAISFQQYKLELATLQ